MAAGNAALPIHPRKPVDGGRKWRERRLFFLPLNLFWPQIRLTATPSGGKRRPARRPGSNHQGQVCQRSMEATLVGMLAPPRTFIVAARVTQTEAAQHRSVSLQPPPSFDASEIFFFFYNLSNRSNNLRGSGLRLCSSGDIYGL